MNNPMAFFKVDRPEFFWQRFHKLRHASRPLHLSFHRPSVLLRMSILFVVLMGLLLILERKERTLVAEIVAFWCSVLHTSGEGTALASFCQTDWFPSVEASWPFVIVFFLVIDVQGAKRRHSVTSTFSFALLCSCRVWNCMRLHRNALLWSTILTVHSPFCLTGAPLVNRSFLASTFRARVFCSEFCLTICCKHV